MDYWNEIVKIRDTTKDSSIKDMANMLLGQMNTAGGKELMKNELIFFINANKGWVQTDPSTNQYGRQHSDILFEFKEDGMEQTCIDLSGYTNGTIESAIRSYGYTLHESNGNEVNIHEAYPDNANWIIAECLFELDIHDNI